MPFGILEDSSSTKPTPNSGFASLSTDDTMKTMSPILGASCFMTNNYLTSGEERVAGEFRGFFRSVFCSVIGVHTPEFSGAMTRFHGPLERTRIHTSPQQRDNSNVHHRDSKQEDKQACGSHVHDR